MRWVPDETFTFPALTVAVLADVPRDKRDHVSSSLAAAFTCENGQMVIIKTKINALEING